MHPSWNDYPHLVAELNPDGNKDLTQYGKPIHVLDLMVGTNKRLDWKCSNCDHEWTSACIKRRDGSGCPVCNRGDLHSDGRNSMAITHPDLALEYQGDATKVIAGTNKKLLWKCRTCEHEWKTNGGNRTSSKRGCPVCKVGTLHSDGRNSMAMTHPHLVIEYQGDATKVVAGTNKKLPWKCSICEHEWKAMGCKRSDKNNPRGCPACSGHTIHSDGRNSMAMTHPDYTLEYQGDATKIMAGTHQKLPWKCLIFSKNPCGYEWEANCKSRTSDGRGCPRCAKYGFKADELGYYYVHKIMNKYGETIMYKAGISGDWKRRQTELRKELPDDLTLELHEVIEFEIGQDAQDLETTLLRKAAEEGWKAPKREFDGGSELFLESPLDHARIHGLI